MALGPQAPSLLPQLNQTEPLPSTVFPIPLKPLWAHVLPITAILFTCMEGCGCEKPWQVQPLLYKYERCMYRLSDEEYIYRTTVGSVIFLRLGLLRQASPERRSCFCNHSRESEKDLSQGEREFSGNRSQRRQPCKLYLTFSL